MAKERTWFDEEWRLVTLSKKGDPLERLNRAIDWEVFRETIEKATVKQDRGTRGGRPPYDAIVKFKMLILQKLYNLSDEQIEYQVLDRLSFMRFLGITLAEKVPDEKTVWYFRERLIEKGVIEKLFDLFEQQLEREGLLARQGSIIDASFVEAPRQRNDREENKQIKGGKRPKGWEKNPAKMRQKDVDARWAKKNNETHYGYKNHVKVDRRSKLIVRYEVTDAAVHDSRVFEVLLDEKDRHHEIYADSAYWSAGLQEVCRRWELRNRILKKGYRNRPLTEKDRAVNKKRSRVRVRVEHVFGFIQNSMKGSTVRSIGGKRARGNIGLMNLVYNMFRAIQLQNACA